MVIHTEREQLIDMLEAKVSAAAVRFAPLYKLLDWQWKIAEPHVPDAGEIAAKIRELLKDLRKSTGGSICSGGLRVWIDERQAGISFECGEGVYI